MTEETPNATIEERLARVETKTDRLIKDVGETRTDIKVLRDVVDANDKSLHNDMKDMELRLIAKQDAATTSLRDQIEATASSLRTDIERSTTALRGEMQGLAEGLRGEMQGLAKRDEMQGLAEGLRAEMKATQTKFDNQLLKVTELVADTKGQFKMLILIMVPITLAACSYLFKLVSAG